MKRLCHVLFTVAIVNFLIFFLMALSIGGDAVNGKVEGGKYYVANHGKYTEVSKTVFTYSRFHCYSVWVTHPVGILAMIAWSMAKRNRKDK
jgi:hypothetical protein